MRSIYRLFALAACTGALGACAGMELESARGLGAGGSSFGQALFDKYIALSESEYREGDYPDSDKFALRARSLAGGRMVEPEPIGNRNLTGAAVGELTSARAKLVEVFAGGARDRKPMEAARAQAMFDCWMQEQEENRQPGHIARCRSGFSEALFALAPPPAKAAAKTVTKPSGGGWPKNYVVFFAHDSSRLDATAQNRINQAAKKVAETGPRSVVVTVKPSGGGWPKNYVVFFAHDSSRTSTPRHRTGLIRPRRKWRKPMGSLRSLSDSASDAGSCGRTPTRARSRPASSAVTPTGRAVVNTT